VSISNEECKECRLSKELIVIAALALAAWWASCAAPPISRGATPVAASVAASAPSGAR